MRLAEVDADACSGSLAVAVQGLLLAVQGGLQGWAPSQAIGGPLGRDFAPTASRSPRQSVEALGPSSPLARWPAGPPPPGPRPKLVAQLRYAAGQH